MILAGLAHPEWQDGIVLALIVVAVALAVALQRAGQRRRALLGPAARPPPLQLAGDVALFAALAAIGLALLGPQLGERWISAPSSGVDAVFVIDVSRSMDAQDVPPSRLARAKRALEELLARLRPGDRAALVAFAGRGALLAPLTPDTQALTQLAGALDTELMRPARSDLADGLAQALSAFEFASERPRVIFVLSDGETRSPRADLEMGVTAARAQVRILAAALGSELGAEIPDHGAVLRDETGRQVVTRRRSQRLAELTDAADGALFVADEWGSFDFAQAAAELRRDAGSAGAEVVLRRVPATRVGPLAALAFALLLVEALPRAGPRRLRRGRGGLALAAIALLLPGALGAQGDADADAAIERTLAAKPRDPRLLVALGVARLERGEHPAAARAFRAAAAYARDPQLAALAYYDLGVAALEEGRLEIARDAFFDVLVLRPGDQRARFNLEWTLRALEAVPPEPEPDAPPSPPARPESPSEGREPPEDDHADARDLAQTQPLDAARSQRLLDRLEDDPARALRRALRGEERRSERAASPAW